MRIHPYVKKDGSRFPGGTKILFTYTPEMVIRKCKLDIMVKLDEAGARKLFHTDKRFGAQMIGLRPGFSHRLYVFYQSGKNLKKKGFLYY
mmetsp:Transcript_17704/g.44747  ORF Transcript_17704/g.44747 Transcript_17704/m.44747 type:complete len:90 (-) Transcript_17704:91-360(-)